LMDVTRWFLLRQVTANGLHARARSRSRMLASSFLRAGRNRHAIHQRRLTTAGWRVTTRAPSSVRLHTYTAQSGASSAAGGPASVQGSGHVITRHQRCTQQQRFASSIEPLSSIISIDDSVIRLTQLL
jgi:hypothetical protein